MLSKREVKTLAEETLRSISSSSYWMTKLIKHILDYGSTYGEMSSAFYSDFETISLDYMEDELDDDDFYAVAEYAYDLLSSRLEKALKF
ncbi:MAG: hypothetical protein ACXABY_11065 [Candidatus Thorarchaeota archaeon]|jgi:hypothetical protein